MPDRTRLQAARKQYLREVRRRQRTADTMIERMERRIYALLDRKTLIDAEDGLELYDRYWRPFWSAVQDLEKGMADFISATQS